jgi:hypothetical protein
MPMNDATDENGRTTAPSGSTGRAGRRRRKGRHAAVATPRSTRLATITPRHWTRSLGVGLAVAVAATTSLTLTSSGATGPPKGGVADETAPGAASKAPSGTPQVAIDRQGGASRSADRTAVGSTTAPSPVAAGGVVVPDGVSMSQQKTLDVKITSAAQIEAAEARAAAKAAAKAEAEARAAAEAETVARARAEEKAARTALPGCDGDASGAGTNGEVPSSEMCVLWDGSTTVRADAAVALARLNEAYTAAFGEPMCLSDGYRSYSEQVAVKAAKGYLAATPGTSNHGWGLAVDLCGESYAGERWDWLAAHAPEYGWDNPEWARTSKYEPWHWEYTDAVAQVDAGG